MCVCVCVYIYKMYLILAEGYKYADVLILIIKKTGEVWASMKDAGSGMSVKNIYWEVVYERKDFQRTFC